MNKKKKIDLDIVRHIASLAHINLSIEEEEKFSKQLGDILLYMEKLNSLKTEDIPITYHPIEIYNVFREDSETGQSISQNDALLNAPLAGNGFFKVPKIISND